MDWRKINRRWPLSYAETPGFPELWHDLSEFHFYFAPGIIKRIGRKPGIYYAFVDQLGSLDSQQLPALSNDSMRQHWLQYREREGGPRVPNQEIILDCIEARHFVKIATSVAKLDEPSPDSDEILGKLPAEKLFDGESMRVFTAWLNNEDPHEQTYLAGFQPSTWHLIIIGDEGIPVMESRNYDDDEYKTVNLTYARPATAWELGALLDLVSIDHLPEAGAQ